MSDLISRQAAIDIAKELTITIEGYEMHNQAVMNYCAEIIQLPPIHPVNNSEMPNSSDVISRQAAIDALKEHRALYCDNTPGTFSKLSYAEKSRVDELDTAIATLVNLPPAEPKRGRWIKLDMHRGMADHKCTACEQECYVPTCMGEPMYAYCPNCGAKMEVDDE